MAGLESKLAEDPIHPEDTLYIYSYDGLTGIETKYGVKKANIELKIKDEYVPFYYNKQSTTGELIQQLYNGYKHTRYKAHYDPTPVPCYDMLGEEYYSRL